MFRDYINNLIDPIPAEYVKNLVRLEHEPDFSFTCIGIALLKPRIENYKGIGGCFTPFGTEEGAVTEFITRYENDSDYPIFCYYTYDTSNEEEVLKLINDSEYEIKDNIGAFLKEKADIKCRAIYHKEKNKAAIFINTKDIRYYHLNASFISLLFPKLFEEKPLEGQDYDVVKACSKPDKDMFVQKIRECVQPYAMEFRRIMLNALLKSLHNDKIEYALREVDQQREYIENVKNTLAEAVKNLKTLSVTYEGLRATEQFDEAEEEFVEYLSTNKAIRAMKMEGSVLTFAVATLLNNYNADVWETFAKRGYIFDGEYMYRHEKIKLLDVFEDIENRKRLLCNIFSETPEFAVKIAGNYRIDMHSEYVSAEREYNYCAADPIFKSYLPNPHLKIFHCLGGYEDRIPEALRKRNYIGAVELCCASAGSVDLDETDQTFRPFIGWLMSTREKVLRRKDGTDMTPEEALIYLIDKEKE